MISGIICNEGMGGFLNPPGHPEHFYSVKTGSHRNKENGRSMSLLYARKSSYLDDDTRNRIQGILDKWEKEKPGIEDPEIQKWIRKVNAYFKYCYADPNLDEDVKWNSDNVRILDSTTNESLDLHFGVHWIRNFYPNYEPKPEDFTGSWGDPDA